MSVGQRIAEQAEKGAASASLGQCSKYVRMYVQKALKIPVKPTGIPSAKDTGGYYQELGFKKVQTTEFRNGDIIIMQSSKSKNGKQHPHGHVQVYKDGKWISDFKQKAFSPYLDGHVPSYTVYRYEQPQIQKTQSTQSQTPPVTTNSYTPPVTSNSYSSSKYTPSYSYSSQRRQTGPSWNFGSSSRGWGLSTDNSNYGYTFDNGSRISGGGYTTRSGLGGKLQISIPCSIM